MQTPSRVGAVGGRGGWVGSISRAQTARRPPTADQSATEAASATSFDQISAALAESEERYRLPAENASDVVYQATPDGTIEWISPSALEVLGCPPDELVGTRAILLLRPEDRTAVDVFRATAFAATNPVTVEREFRGPDGDYRWMSVRARPLRDDAGEVQSVAVTLRDCHAEVVARRAATTLSAGNAILVTAENEIDLFGRPEPLS